MPEPVSNPRIARHQQPPQMSGTEGYRTAREYLRRDFGFRCAYCMIHEQQVGGPEGFCIDHFWPRSKGGAANDYGNLYWACIGCNRFKGDAWPGESERRRGRRFADPCQEQDYGVHFVEGRTGTLEHRTPCGEYHVYRLRLNRPSRVARRLERNELLRRLERALALVRELDQETGSPTELALLDHIRREIEALRGELAFSIPFIPPLEGT